jgi:hypothetical protein
VSSVALSKPAGSKMTAVKWIAAVVVLTALVIGGLFAAGVFSGVAPGPASAASSARPAPSSVPVDVAPLNPPQGAVPPRAAEPTAVPASPTASDSRFATTPPAGASGQNLAGTAPPANAGTAAAGLAAAGAKSSGAPGDRPISAAGGFGGVKVTSAIDLQVFENGSLVGSTAGSIAVVEGSHTFELVNEPLGFRVRSTVSVRAGQLTPVAIAVPSARLSLNAVPWADVFIDGKPAGQTPLANVMVPIGSHVVVFRHPQLGEQTQTVIVKADGLTRASATFKQ